MSSMGIVLAAVIVGGTGLVISVLLGIASEKFKVPIDEKEVAVRECLPCRRSCRSRADRTDHGCGSRRY